MSRTKLWWEQRINPERNGRREGVEEEAVMVSGWQSPKSPGKTELCPLRSELAGCLLWGAGDLSAPSLQSPSCPAEMHSAGTRWHPLRSGSPCLSSTCETYQIPILLILYLFLYLFFFFTSKRLYFWATLLSFKCPSQHNQFCFWSRIFKHLFFGI